MGHSTRDCCAVHLLSARSSKDLPVCSATVAVLPYPTPHTQTQSLLSVLSPHPSLLQYLRAIVQALAPLGPQVVLYLAAAVSDFYLPWSELVGAHINMNTRIHEFCKSVTLNTFRCSQRTQLHTRRPRVMSALTAHKGTAEQSLWVPEGGGGCSCCGRRGGASSPHGDAFGHTA
jgi:hypothetical protein